MKNNVHGLSKSGELVILSDVHVGAAEFCEKEFLSPAALDSWGRICVSAWWLMVTMSFAPIIITPARRIILSIL